MRKKGWYWVKLFDEWLIAEFYGNHWYTSHLGYLSDSDFEEIDERPIKRPE